jgi:hypothetical protein
MVLLNGIVMVLHPHKNFIRALMDAVMVHASLLPAPRRHAKSSERLVEYGQMDVEATSSAEHALLGLVQMENAHAHLIAL